MAMKRSNALGGSGGKGGGPGSRSLAPKLNTYFTGQPANRTSPGGVSQIGESLGNHVSGIDGGGKTVGRAVEPMYSGNLVRPGQPGLGNAVALNVGGGGPGTGRTLFGQAGTNAQHGPAAGKPAPQGREILREFGPDVPGRK
jgi:hypothetical protein